jgi:integrase
VAAPDSETLQGLRDRAILSLALHVGATRTEIAALRVRDFQFRGGFDCVRLPLERVTRRLPLHPAVAERVRGYLAAEGHADQPSAPLFRLVRRSMRARQGAGGLQPAMIDQIVRKYARKLGLGEGYSTLSLRATYLADTTGLAPGADAGSRRSA